MLYWILRPLLWLFYKTFYRVKVFGKENLIKKGKNIVACNHLGKADVLVVGALYPNKTIFLFFIPLLPPLAGIRANIFFPKYIFSP